MLLFINHIFLYINSFFAGVATLKYLYSESEDLAKKASWVDESKVLFR